MKDLTPELITNISTIIKKIKAKEFSQVKTVFAKVFHGSKNHIYTLLLIPYQNSSSGIEIYPGDEGLMSFIDEQTNIYFDRSEHRSISCIADYGYKPFQLLCNINLDANDDNNIPNMYVKDLEFITELLIHDLSSKKSKLCSEDKVYLVCDYYESQYELFKVTEIPYSYNYPFKITNKKIVEELKELPTNEGSYVFYTSYFATEVDSDSYKLFVAYGKKIELFSDIDILDNLTLEQAWSYLLSLMQKYGKPKVLEINNPKLFCSMLKTLMAAGIEVKYNRYDLMQNLYARDLLQFAKAYFVKYEYDPNELYKYMHKALNILNDFLIEGYNPETQKLAEAFMEYSDIVENSEDKSEDTLVS